MKTKVTTGLHQGQNILVTDGLKPGEQVKTILKHSDGTSEEIILNHTMNEQQLGWFKSGSALNMMARKNS